VAIYEISTQPGKNTKTQKNRKIIYKFTMTTTLSQESMQEITKGLQSSLAVFASRYPGESGRRQPVHTVYGGAHLFKSDTASRLGTLAMRSFDTYAPDAKTFAQVL